LTTRKAYEQVINLKFMFSKITAINRISILSILFFSVLALCVGCGEETKDTLEELIIEDRQFKPKKSLPSSTGAKGEIIIVCPDSIWEGNAGGVIRNTLGGMQPGTKYENWFDLFQIRERDLKEMLKRTRHLIHISAGDKNRSEHIRDMYATPQEYLYISYTDKASLDSMIMPAMRESFFRFRDLDMEIVRKKWKNKVWPTPKPLKKRGIEFIFPKSFQTTVDTEDLMVAWASSSKADLVMFISVRPYTPIDQVNFQPNDIIKWRDSITKAHVPADAPGSYVQTETDPEPERKLTKVGSHIAFETRGYFRSIGDFMGGSFINFVIFDEERERMIMLDGLVYAPNEKKRGILYELEAIFRSIELK
jgi:hypothetical protein